MATSRRTHHAREPAMDENSCENFTTRHISDAGVWGAGRRRRPEAPNVQTGDVTNDRSSLGKDVSLRNDGRKDQPSMRASSSSEMSKSA